MLGRRFTTKSLKGEKGKENDYLKRVNSTGLPFDIESCQCFSSVIDPTFCEESLWEKLRIFRKRHILSSMRISFRHVPESTMFVILSTLNIHLLDLWELKLKHLHQRNLLLNAHCSFERLVSRNHSDKGTRRSRHGSPVTSINEGIWMEIM